MLNILKEETQKVGQKFIYVYDDEPDHTMHDFGPDDEKVQELIKLRNDKIEQFCANLKNSIVIIVADHGHIKVEPIFLKDYPELVNLLERTTSIEPRAVSFKIKAPFKEKFKKKFNELFGEDFSLYDKKEILDSCLFGDGSVNELFVSAIGDFIAISTSNKCILDDGDTNLVSMHAGWTDDEIYIPVIVIDRA